MDYLKRLLFVLVVLFSVIMISCDNSSNDDDTKLCALTFDDGPDATLTPLVVDKLEKHGIVATFFLVGQKLTDGTNGTSDVRPVINRMVNNGYEFNNHSWTYDSMDTMDQTDVETSINDTNNAINTYTGQTPHFFRPPNLATSSNLYSYIDLPFASGILAYDWDTSKTAQDRADYILNDARMRDGAIILMHDVQPLPHPTPEALDIIIPELKKRGFEFVTLSELFSRKNIVPATDEEKMWEVVE